jgi:hypothetical protein
MSEVFLLFQTDNWLSYASRVLFGVFSSYESALAAAEEENLEDDDSKFDIV